MTASPLIIPGLGPSEVVIIVVLAVVLIIGAKKIPELARSLGRSTGEFQKGRQEVEKELREATRTDTDSSEYERVASAARALGLTTEGKTLEQLKEEIRKATWR